MSKLVLTLLIVLLTTIVKVSCSGKLVAFINSPKSAFITATVCTTPSCPIPDSSSALSPLYSDIPLKIMSPDFMDPQRFFDIHIMIYRNNNTNDLIGSTHFTSEFDSTWQYANIETTEMFNVTLKVKTVCDKHYYGKKCDRLCKENPFLHLECSKSGEKRCKDGWSGADCMKPICAENCNGHGKCTLPGKCQCAPGFAGDLCEKCITKKGCVHGTCANNTSYTCQCEPGFAGELCNKKQETCTIEKPCMNGGICRNARLGRFHCECPEGFFGDRCETPVSVVKCQHENGQNVCLNGGVCSLAKSVIHCECREGFKGKFCELPQTCEDVKCKNNGECVLIDGKIPVCQCSPCYRGKFCEILDSECLVARYNATVAKIHSARFNNHSLIVVEATISTRSIIFMTSILILVIVVMVLTFLYLTRNRASSRTADEDLDSETTFHRKPTFKVCVINAERHSSTVAPRTSSPPPEYSPPPPRYSKEYHKVPTIDPKEIIV
ncbi:unnamed protein product [Caenorhabditis bovis]|uniref:Delta-like protein n=1 Tax=Caenorhabditis bovis TaxID=2654633 RepID=A0A8S1E6F7_9PELO|nr:unnamed protein product [Caenorhabditis bovis]